MKTRRSWRNQQRLWKYLTPPAPAKPQTVATPRTNADIDAMFWLSKQDKRLLKKDAEKQRKSQG